MSLPRLVERASAAIVLACVAVAVAAQDVTVFAAASLTNVFEDVAKSYRAKGGGGVKFSFASSSTLVSAHWDSSNTSATSSHQRCSPSWPW